MVMDDAIRKRIYEILEEQKISLTALALKSLMTPSTLFEFMNGRTQMPKADTVKRICYGAGMRLRDFYARDYFDDFDDVVR